MPNVAMPDPIHQTPAQIDFSVAVINSLGIVPNFMILPRNYPVNAAGVPAANEVLIVDLVNIDFDATTRMAMYNEANLIHVIQGLRQGVPLPPVSVQRLYGGRFRLLNGFHRFFASVLAGFQSIPVSVPRPVVHAPVAAGPAYVPPHVRRAMAAAVAAAAAMPAAAAAAAAPPPASAAATTSATIAAFKSPAK